MIKKTQIAVLAMILSVVVTTAPVSSLYYGQGQIQATSAEELVEIADRAEQQVKNLSDLVYENETALQTIEAVGLIDALESNVTLYNAGVGNLTQAHKALEIADYAGSVDYATEALSIFREVFSSIHIILEEAGLQKGHLVDNQGLLEAMTRQLQRINQLREILPEDAPEEIKQLLNDVEALLDVDAARELLLEGNETEVISNLQEAKQLITQVYEYLKAQAEESNTWRINNYCQMVQERIQERFRAGNQTGVDFTGVLESLGYESESQFMNSLNAMTQTAQDKNGDFKSAMQDLEAIGQMVQEMDQALTQEMQRHQGGNGSAGGDSAYGSGGMGSGGNGP